MTEIQDMESDQPDNQHTTQSASLGAVIQAARLAKNMTQQDVSNALRFSAKQIDALENNAFDLLPDAMITRGFIRNYARLLEIDAEPLLASYRASVSTETDKVIAVKSSMRPVQLTKESQPWLKYILASILVLFFLLAWLFYVDYMPKQSVVVPENTTEAVTEAAPAVTQPLPEIALPAAQREADAELAAANVVEGTNSAADVQTTESNSPDATLARADSKLVLQSVQQTNANQQTQTAKQLPALQQPPQVPVAASAAKSVNLVFSDQTWVSVIDKSGKVVYEKMSNNGDKETVNGTPPFNLVIGNASATKLSFGGKDIDLTAYTKNNVARITLE
jgi:cytoskeleton protein RodZ